MKKPVAALVPGRAYAFGYPRYNYQQLPEKRERRRIVVTVIRDLRQCPLDPRTAKLNPWLNRGRYLVTGEDLDRGQERSFYVERMTDVHELPIASESSYAVVVHDLVRFRTDALCAAIAYRLGCQRGSVWGRLT